MSCGVNLQQLKQIAVMQRRYFQFFCIACGTAPISGQDGQILPRHPSAARQMAGGGEEELSLVPDIEKDDVICQIVPPTGGTPGNTVTGAPVPGEDGKPARIPRGRNTALSQDGQYLIATRPGRLEYSGRNFRVKPVLEIFGNRARIAP